MKHTANSDREIPVPSLAPIPKQRIRVACQSVEAPFRVIVRAILTGLPTKKGTDYCERYIKRHAEALPIPVRYVLFRALADHIGVPFREPEKGEQWTLDIC